MKTHNTKTVTKVLTVISWIGLASCSIKLIQNLGMLLMAGAFGGRFLAIMADPVAMVLAFILLVALKTGQRGKVVSIFMLAAALVKIWNQFLMPNVMVPGAFSEALDAAGILELVWYGFVALMCALLVRRAFRDKPQKPMPAAALAVGIALFAAQIILPLAVYIPLIDFTSVPGTMPAVLALDYAVMFVPFALFLIAYFCLRDNGVCDGFLMRRAPQEQPEERN